MAFFSWKYSLNVSFKARVSQRTEEVYRPYLILHCVILNQSVDHKYWLIRLCGRGVCKFLLYVPLWDAYDNIFFIIFFKSAGEKKVKKKKV